MEKVRLAKVALSAATFAIDKPYDYLIPPELEDTLLAGMRVIVPFGAGNRRAEGLVLATETLEPGKKLKTILTQLDDTPVLDGEGVKLALWMRERWFCTVYDAARAMLPAGLYFSLQDRYRLAEGITEEVALEAAGRSEHAQRVVQLAAPKKGVELGQIKSAFGTRDPKPAIKLLMDKGVLVLETSVSRGVGDKTEQMATLRIPPEEALAQVSPRRRSAPQRYAVTELLCTMGSASTKELCYFTGASQATLRSLSKSGIITLEKREVLRRVTIQEKLPPAEPLILNAQQQTAFDGLDALARSGKASAALLYGITGSGKTQVYIQLIQSALNRGRTAMVLVPEISLTPQLLQIFTSHFGGEVAVLHSSLRAGERYDEWRRVRDGRARVVLGTRSAIFAPLEALGIIVLDEEQEYSYKSDNVPSYHARDVAKYRCAQNAALLVLGSATPSVESMYLAKTGVYHLFTLATRYNQRSLPSVSIADMRQELQQGNGTSLSQPLREALRENLRAGEQSILFLNRRGANRMATCGECGQVPTCPRCSVYLTYHSANGRLMCHYCGHSEPMPDDCPSCGGTLRFVGAGTQKVQEELQVLFPSVEILRMDTDTITAAQSHEKLLARFRTEKIPILLGTQMVTKGLDFENVTLVGVIAADQSLYVDDYRAGERTFSLVTQVVGRAGRGGKPGRAIIQTFTPENDVISFAAEQNYDAFYDQEIYLRQLRNCPPFQDLFVITASGPEESAVLRTCMRLRRTLEAWIPHPPGEPQLLGPAPASVVKVNNRYRYRLTLTGTNTRQLRELIAHLVRCAQTDRENRGVSVIADVNPLD